MFECLLEEEERSLKENPVDSVQWAEVVLSVNSVIKVQPRWREFESFFRFYPLNFENLGKDSVNHK